MNPKNTTDEFILSIKSKYVKQCLPILHNSIAHKLIYNANDDTVIISFEDGTIAIRNLKTNKIISSIKAFDNEVKDICLLEDAKHHQKLVCIGHERLKLLDLKTQIFDLDINLPIAELAFIGLIKTNNGNQLITVPTHNECHLLMDIQKSKIVLIAKIYFKSGPSLVIQIDSNLIAMSHDSIISIHDINKNFKKCRCFNGHERGITSLKKVTNGKDKLIISASFDHLIKLFNVNTGNLLRVFVMHQSWILSLLVIQDGFFVSGGLDGKLGFWNVEQNTPLLTLQITNSVVFNISKIGSNHIVICGTSKFIEMIKF